MSDIMHCYRHPNRETRVSCNECSRPICEDCMTFAPVGIRCPDHAVGAKPKPSMQRTVRQTKGAVKRAGAPATVALIALNLAVYVLTVAQGGGIDRPGGDAFFDGALVGFLIDVNGDWHRLVTAMFLHGGILHIAFNMFALYWIGSVVEEALGTWRYVLVYFASGLAGSAGALLLSNPVQPTVGASGAIYGILGALLILEYITTGSFAGQAMGIIVLNLMLTLAIPNISLGGHLGGLVGGVVATYGLMKLRYKRQWWLAPAWIVLVGVVAVAVAYARVKSYTY